MSILWMDIALGSLMCHIKENLENQGLLVQVWLPDCAIRI